MVSPGVIGNKPHQLPNRCLRCLGVRYSGRLRQSIGHEHYTTLKDLILILHNLQLPYLEVNAIISPLSGRISSKLEDNIRAAIDSAKAKGETKEFPVRVKKNDRPLRAGQYSSRSNRVVCLMEDLVHAR